jgi:thiamine biosynthesis protein ThiS
MGELIEIDLNGKKEHIQNGLSLKSLLDSMGVNSNLVACELNLKIIRRANLDQTALKPGDTLEIIQMIGGG